MARSRPDSSPASGGDAPGSPRLLILAASVGAGHMRAAQAVELALRELAPEAHVQNVDVLPLTNAVFRRLYAQAYLDLVNRAPHLLGYIYDLTDKPAKRSRGGERLHRLSQRLHLGKVIRLLEQPWDLVINTHFLPADIIASRRRKGLLDVPQFTVVTDFDAHAFWLNQPAERYFVGGEEAAWSLASWGVPRETITPTGIPIHPCFASSRSIEGCREKHKLSKDRPVVLLLAGGFGVGPIERVYDALLKVETPIHAAVVCGKNAALRARLEKTAVPPRHRANILGFTTEIDELMAAADVVVSKPGGLTTSEALARGSAMVIINPIPGQESRNSDMLLEAGAAIKVNSVSALAPKLSALLADAPRLARLRVAAKALGKPRAAYDVAGAALAFARDRAVVRARSKA